RISNYDLMMQLIDFCLEHPVEEVLEPPDVKERVDLYFSQQQEFKAQLMRVTKMKGDVAVIYLKDEEIIYTGNRFLIYALFPQAKISVHVMWGFRKQNTAVTIGKSIVNRSSTIDIGEICHYYGGGGHRNAGTCQLPNDEIDGILPDIINLLNEKTTLKALDKKKGPQF
ncbi:MAG: exopolyphosphatase, partial [Eubacterium sp.]|nr:exopolyphosphatase [Eubacterium sp.]